MDPRGGDRREEAAPPRAGCTDRWQWLPPTSQVPRSLPEKKGLRQRAEYSAIKVILPPDKDHAKSQPC